MILTGKKAIFAASASLLLLLALIIWFNSRPTRVLFSNGSSFDLYKLSYGNNFVYYRQAPILVIAAKRYSEKAWRWIERRFPSIPRALRISNVCSSIQTRAPNLVVVGTARFIPVLSPFWEFVAVDAQGNESTPMETLALDEALNPESTKSRIGPGILAWTTDLPAEPQFVRVYEVARKSRTRKLIAVLNITERRVISRPPFVASTAPSSTNAEPKPEEPQTWRDYEQVVEEDRADKLRPHVLTVFPADGAEAVDPITELRIQFDRPMNPLSLKLDWRAGGFLQCGDSTYDSNRYEFTIPVTLEPGTTHQVIVNNVFGGHARTPGILRDGFQDANGPDVRLAGFFVWTFQTAEPAPQPKPRAPRVTSILPPTGSRVPALTFVDIQFDQPISPPDKALPYVAEFDPFLRPELLPFVESDQNNTRVRIPLILKSGKKTTFALAGFKSASGIPAKPIRLTYETAEENISGPLRTATHAAASEPRLLELLSRMKQQRAELSSIAQRAQNITLNTGRGKFVSIHATTTRFMWQAPAQYYGDVSEIMRTTAFRIGSDGTNWWWHVKNAYTNLLQLCPVAEVHELDASFCDPFGLIDRTPQAASLELGLRYLGDQPGGLHRIERWIVQPSAEWTHASRTEWRIDPKTSFPAEIVHHFPGSIHRTRFFYDAVNTPLPREAFAPPSTHWNPPEPLDDRYTNRFVKIRDGTDGGMSLRWGKQGPGGMSSSGLN